MKMPTKVDLCKKETVNGLTQICVGILPIQMSRIKPKFLIIPTPWLTQILFTFIEYQVL